MPDPRKKRYVMDQDSEAAIVGPNRIIGYRPPTYREATDLVIPPEAPAAPPAAPSQAPLPPLRQMQQGPAPEGRKPLTDEDIDRAIADLDRMTSESLDPRKLR
jgi:hypothetical protein